MELGDRVRTTIALPGLPAGSLGRVREADRLFVTVEFEGGRTGYYPRHQLARVDDPGMGDRGVAERAADLGFTKEQLSYGSHLCLLPSSEREEINVAARYLAAGLRAGDAVFCIVPPPLLGKVRAAIDRIIQETAATLSPSDVVFFDPEDVYLPGTEFTAERQLARIAELFGSSEWPSGKRLRGFGQVGSVVARLDLDQWFGYERGATPLLASSATLGLCGYDPGGWQTEAWRRAYAVHPYVVSLGRLASGGSWVS